MKQLHRALSRRAVLAGGLMAAAALVPNRGLAQDASITPASLRRAGKTVLNFRAWERYPASDIPGLNRFLDRHPDLSIEWSSAPWSRYPDVITTECMGGTPLDVVQIPEINLAAWADSGWLMPLDGFNGLADIFAKATPAAVQGTKGTDGKTYGLPYLSDAFGFAYDAPTLAKAGFASTAKNLDELRTQMQAVKKMGIDPFPLSLAMKKQPGQFWSLWATLYASGGELFDDTNTPVFDKPGNPLEPILDWYVAALNDWKIVGPEDLQWDWGASRTGMRSGTVKFGYMSQYALAEFNVWADSRVTGQIRMGLVPGLERNDVGTVGYAHSVGLAAVTKHKDAAWTVIRGYVGPGESGDYELPRARALSEGGRCPYPNLTSDPAVGKLVAQMTGGDTAAFNALSGLGRQRKGIKSIWYPEWELFMMAQVQEALLKKITVKAAIKASAAEARRLAAA
jgi:multiple sugar transport system substrate-binding protein